MVPRAERTIGQSAYIEIGKKSFARANGLARLRFCRQARRNIDIRIEPAVTRLTAISPVQKNAHWHKKRPPAYNRRTRHPPTRPRRAAGIRRAFSRRLKKPLLFRGLRSCMCTPPARRAGVASRTPRSLWVNRSSIQDYGHSPNGKTAH